MRIGAKKRPFYRVVAVNEQAKRTGGYIELLGTYNPLTTPKEINLKQDRIDHWIKQGAQMTNGYLRIIGKAKQRLPQKAKKAAKIAPEKAESVEKVEQTSKPVDATPAITEPEAKEVETEVKTEEPKALEPEEKTDERPS